MNALTIGDVFKPLETKDILTAKALAGQIDAAKVQNRLALMQEQDYMNDREQKQGLMDAVTKGYGNAAPSVNAFVDPGTAPIGDRPLLQRLKGQESGGDYTISNRSGSGAMGAYQIIPGTWKQFAPKVGLAPDAPMTLKNQDKVATYMHDYYLNKYGDERLVAAAWYGGEGVADGIKNGTMSQEALNRPQVYNGDQYPSIAQYIQQVTGKSLSRPGVQPGPQSGPTQPPTPKLPPNIRNVGGGYYKLDPTTGQGHLMDDAQAQQEIAAFNATQQPPTNALMSSEPPQTQQRGSMLTPGRSNNYQFGEVLGYQKLKEMQLAEAAAREEIRVKQMTETMKWWEPAYKEIIKSGDDTRLQEFFKSSAKNPVLAPVVSALSGMRLTGPDKGEYIGNLDRQKLDMLLPMVKDPGMAATIKTAVPGPYEIKFKNGIVTEFKPADDKSAGIGREAAYQAIKQELQAKGENREPTTAEIDQRLFDQSKMSKTGEGKMSKIQLAYSNVVERLQREGQNRKPRASEVTKALMDINRDESKSRKPDDADSDLFKNWTPEAKLVAFETALVGNKPKWSGMMATYNQQPFEHEYAQWRANNNLTGFESEAIKKEFVAKASALRKLEENQTFIAQSIKQADKNADALLTTSKAFQRSDYPAPNKVINWWSKNFGSVERQSELGQFGVALLAFSREYMKVVTGSARSVAELSLGAQATADEILSKFDNWQVLEAKVKQAKIEMENTDVSNQEQIAEVHQGLNNFRLSGRFGETKTTEHGKKGKLPESALGEYIQKAKKALPEADRTDKAKVKAKTMELVTKDGWSL